LLDQWEDKGPWVLLLVLPLAALSFRKGLLCFALLLLLPLPKNSYAFEWQDLWQSKDQQAQQAYKNNQFEQAAKLFENPDWKAAAHYKVGEYDKALENLKNNRSALSALSALSAYNQGNALAQSGQLEQAIKAYEKALTINPDDSDAKYNKALVEKELEKQKQEQQQQDDKQQQSKEDSQPGKEGDKSEKSEEQKKSEQKPEQSEEKKSQQQQADEQASPENKEQQNKPEEKKPDTDKAHQAEQKKVEGKEQPKQTPANALPSNEEQQANEQWLKRIPDDPAGLLKRKFKYQYGQKGRQLENNNGW